MANVACIIMSVYTCRNPCGDIKMACSHDTPKSFLNQSAAANKTAKDEPRNDVENEDGLGDANPFPKEEEEGKKEGVERKPIPKDLRFLQSLHMPNHQIVNTQQEACVTLHSVHVPNEVHVQDTLRPEHEHPEPLDPQHEASIELHGIPEPEHKPPTENPLQQDHERHTESPTNTEHEPHTLPSEHEPHEEAESDDKANVESLAEDPELSSPSPPTPQDQELQQFLETAVQKSVEEVEWGYQSQLVAPNPLLPVKLPRSSCLVPNPCCSQPEPPTSTVSSETGSSALCHPVKLFNNCVPVFIHGLRVEEVEWDYQSQLVAPNPPLLVDLPPASYLVPNPCSQPELPTANSKTVSPGGCYPGNGDVPGFFW